MTDKPYAGRSGGRYVRASRDEPFRKVDDADPAPTSADTSDSAPDSDKAAAPAAGKAADKPVRKRS